MIKLHKKSQILLSFCQTLVSKHHHFFLGIPKIIAMSLLLLLFESIITNSSFLKTIKLANFRSLIFPIPNLAENSHNQSEFLTQIFSETIQKIQPKARQIANETAQQGWQKLEKNLLARIDEFLAWYFNYLTQKSQDIKTGMIYSESLIKNDFHLAAANQDFTTKFIENFQDIFEAKVLQPEQVDLQTREIAVEVLKQYLEEILKSLDAVPQKYNINQTDWENYLNHVVIIIKSGQNHHFSLPLKSVSSLENNQKLKQLIATNPDWVKTEMLAKIAKQGAIKILAKTGTNTAAILGVRLIGKKVLALGGIAWELWDYNHAIEVEKPAMRQELIENLILVRADVLYQPEYGIMSVIDGLEISVQNDWE